MITKPLPIWQPRFYDFNVWTEHKRIEKLRHMHRNPVKRGLVEEPEIEAMPLVKRDWYGSMILIFCG